MLAAACRCLQICDEQIDKHQADASREAIFQAAFARAVLQHLPSPLDTCRDILGVGGRRRPWEAVGGGRPMAGHGGWLAAINHTRRTSYKALYICKGQI